MFVSQKGMKRSREILLRIKDTVVVLGQQNILFQGHKWNKGKQIDGHFLRFL